MERSFQKILLEELRTALSPLAEASMDGERLAWLFGQIGWRIDSIGGLDVAGLASALGAAYDGVAGLLAHPPRTIRELRSALSRLQATFDALRAVSAAARAPGGSVPAEFGDVGKELASLLLALHLMRNHPAAYQALVLLGIVRHPADIPAAELPAPVAHGTELARLPKATPRVDFERFGALLEDPEGTLRAEYFPRGLATGADADAAADKLFPRLAAFLTGVGVSARYGARASHRDPGGPDGVDWGPFGNAVVPRMLTVWKRLDLAPDETAGVAPELEVTVGAVLALSSPDRGDLGLVVSPFGAVDVSLDLGRPPSGGPTGSPRAAWRLELELSGAMRGFAIRSKDRFVVLAGAGAQALSGAIGLARLPSAPDEPALRVGSTAGTRLELGSFRLRADVAFDGERADCGVLLDASKAAIVVAGGDGDGFLARILPPGGARLEFDLGVGWSLSRGFHLAGGAGLRAVVPVHGSILGVLRIETVDLEISAVQGKLVLAAAVNAAVDIGPVVAEIHRMGLEGAVSFREDGNLGPADVDLGFKLPDGITLGVRAPPIAGGGSIVADETGYRGSLALRFETFGFAAFAILTTKLPSGEEGYSLLAMLFGEFDLQLGMGFRLTGLGGLVGVHRAANVESLRGSLREGRLDRVLMPREPIHDASRILAELQTVFPVREGTHVLGPMARIAWGTPTIVEAKVGLVVELGGSIRALLLGQIRAALPDPQDPVIVLGVDFLAAIDFDARTVALDATLTRSRLLDWPLSGDLAVRTGWGSRAAFILAVGGFHPRFQAPEGFPSLRPMAISFGGENPRITLAGYLALSSNTAQTGARIDLHYAKDVAALGRIEVEGEAWFDAILRLNPLAFDVALGLALVLLVDGDALASIGGELRLTGPNPYTLSGTVWAEVLRMKVRVPISGTFGSARRAVEQRASALALLQAAVRDPRCWEAIAPESLVTGVALAIRKPAPASMVHVDPVAGLRFVERAVPLEVKIDKLGAARLSDDHDRLSVAAVVAGRALELPTAYAPFAPGQFMDLGGEEQLGAPPTEDYVAGFELAGADALEFAEEAVIPMTYEYETLAIVDGSRSPPAPPAPLDDTLRSRWFGESLRDLARPRAFGWEPAETRAGAAHVRPPAYVVSASEAGAAEAVTMTFAVAHEAARGRDVFASEVAAQLQGSG